MSQFLQKPVLLLITEQLPIIAWIREELGEQFYLLETESVDSALNTLKQTLIDLIILDGAFSLEACSKIKQSLSKRTTPILLITGKLNRNYREAAFLAGVSDFLSDTLDSNELHTLIEASLKSMQTEGKIMDLSMLIPIPTAQASSNFFQSRALLNEKLPSFFNENKGNEIFFVLARIDHTKQFKAISLEEISSIIEKKIQYLIGEESLVFPSSSLGEFIILTTKQNSFDDLILKLQNELKTISIQAKHSVTLSFATAKTMMDEDIFDHLLMKATNALKNLSNATNLILHIDEGKI